MMPTCCLTVVHLLTICCPPDVHLTDGLWFEGLILRVYGVLGRLWGVLFEGGRGGAMANLK